MRRAAGSVRLGTYADSERPHHATAAPIDGSPPILMRPIRLLILLPAVALALAIGLVRPLQGRAGSLRTATAARGGAPPLPARRRHMSFDPPDAATGFGRRVAAYARHLLGVPYRWGGTSPRTGFDCSGLVRFVYGHFGIALPTSRAAGASPAASSSPATSCSSRTRATSASTSVTAVSSTRRTPAASCASRA